METLPIVENTLLEPSSLMPNNNNYSDDGANNIEFTKVKNMKAPADHIVIGLDSDSEGDENGQEENDNYEDTTMGEINIEEVDIDQGGAFHTVKSSRREGNKKKKFAKRRRNLSSSRVHTHANDNDNTTTLTIITATTTAERTNVAGVKSTSVGSKGCGGVSKKKHTPGATGDNNKEKPARKGRSGPNVTIHPLKEVNARGRLSACKSFRAIATLKDKEDWKEQAAEYAMVYVARTLLHQVKVQKGDERYKSIQARISDHCAGVHNADQIFDKLVEDKELVSDYMNLLKEMSLVNLSKDNMYKCYSDDRYKSR